MEGLQIAWSLGLKWVMLEMDHTIAIQLIQVASDEVGTKPLVASLWTATLRQGTAPATCISMESKNLAWPEKSETSAGIAQVSETGPSHGQEKPNHQPALRRSQIQK